MSFLYFLPVGLPDAFKPAERDHRNSRFVFPSRGSKGLCLSLSLLSCGKETSEFVPKVRQVQALSTQNARVGRSLACLQADREPVLAKIIRAWPGEAVRCVLPGARRFVLEEKGESSAVCLPSLPLHSSTPVRQTRT